jgi:DNA-binding transcriptional LysR family regulator
MLFDERRIRAFVAVAERLNFTRAAADLGVAQQPLSQQIARFERDLGVRLFERTTRSVTLTAAGSALYRDALDLLARNERAHRNALEASSGAAGQITIGVGNYAIDTILTDILRAFRERFPNVTVSLYEHHTVDQLDALRSGEIDVGFALLAPDHEDIEREVMHEEGWVLARPGEAGVIGDAPRALAEFRDAAFVAAPRQFSPGLDDMKTVLFRNAGFRPAIAQYAMQTSTMLALVAAGVGLLLTPAATQNLRRSGVEFVRIASSLRVQLHMIARRSERPSTVLENFRAIARERRDRSGWLTERASTTAR